MTPKLTHSLSACTVWVPLAQGWYVHSEGSERLVETETKMLGSITSQRADTACSSRTLRASFSDGVGVGLPHKMQDT